MNDYISRGEDFLAHHGILGQKWGVRRYQNSDGSLTPEGRKRYGVKSSEDDGKNKKQKKELTPEEKAAKEKEKHEKMKDYLRRHPTKLPKYSREITREEADEIISNIQFDRKLQNIRDEEINRGFQRVQSIAGRIGTINTLMQNGKNLYNNTAEIYNSMVDYGTIDGEKMLVIGGNNKREENRKAFEKELLTAKAEDVLQNQEKYTTKELEDYKKRQNLRSNIYDYTEEGKKNASKQSNDKVKLDAFEKFIKDGNYDKAKDEDPDRFEELMKAINSVS